MRLRKATIAALALAAAALVLALVFGGKEDSKRAQAAEPEFEQNRPSIEIVSPRNGARQTGHAVVVKVEVNNFRLAPGKFGQAPELGEGHIRYSLNRVPDCVYPVKLQHAIDSPIGRGRLTGPSMDYPKFAGPNGRLAEQIGTAGSYSPGTRTSIYYHELPAGFYRMVVNLAHNNGATTGAHDVTNFEILPKPGHAPKPCEEGKVPSTDAAGGLR
ncbi:MAG: hypothetical protein R2725_10510 [Solirubrobacterales bacterium]